MFDAKSYAPAGPVMKAFHESDKFFRLVAGPIGSSKTTGAGVAEVVFTAMLQKPQADGVRRAKVGVLRDTYRNLYATFIPTWQLWFPKDLGRFVGSDDRPAVHEFPLETPVGPCEITVEMRALGPNTVEAVCRGWELSGCYLDEMDLMPREALSFLAGRVQRYPQKQYRNSRGVWGTFNKPDTDHWLYDLCVESPPENLGFFDQPGGLLDGEPYRTNPQAENLVHLDDGYYEISAQGQPGWYVTRMLRNRWGASISGERIYPEFSDLHVSPVELQPPPRSTLTLCFDAGGTPAAAVLGREQSGRRICYGELVLVDPYDPKQRKLQQGVGPKRFGQTVKDWFWQRFPNCSIGSVYADPAAQYGADREAGEYSWIEIVGQELGVPVQAAPSNEIDLRHEAVRVGLRSLGFDGRPQLILNPSCKWLRRGFVSDYKWEEADPKQPGKKLKPQKSVTSHVHDALQYGMLGDIGRAGVTSGAAHDRWQPKKDAGVIGSATWADVTRMQARQQGGGPAYSSDFDLWK